MTDAPPADEERVKLSDQLYKARDELSRAQGELYQISYQRALAERIEAAKQRAHDLTGEANLRIRESLEAGESAQPEAARPAIDPAIVQQGAPEANMQPVAEAASGRQGAETQTNDKASYLITPGVEIAQEAIDAGRNGLRSAEPVSQLTGDEFGKSDVSLKDRVLEFFASFGNKVVIRGSEILRSTKRPLTMRGAWGN